jgi:serine/threonine-protein kinase
VTQPYGAVKTRVGQTVCGKYKLVRVLGKGGMGEVYEAQHSVVGRRFAIKFLHPNLAGNTEVVARFQREAQSAGKLENENIAAVVDAGTADDGAPYLVMEYLEGEDLAHLLSRCGPLPVPRAAYIIIQACRGLVSAHEHNIVHRDLKPENLFVCRRNDGGDLVKVLDFGIAKLRATGDGTGLTHTGTTMGTPFYMSLEQARGAKEVDHRTDIYSLGVILYEILTGAKPHPGDSYNQILYHVIAHEPAPLDSVRSGLPAGLPAVVNKAMAREASDRFASVAGLKDALLPFAGNVITPMRSQLGIPSVPGDTLPTPGSLRGIVVPTPAPPPLMGTVQPPHSQSRLFLVGAVVVLAIVLATVALWSAMARQRRPQASVAPVAAPAQVSPGGAPMPIIAEPASEIVKSPAQRSVAIVEIDDAPPALQVTVDGLPKELPLELPYGPAMHTLAFYAPGYDSTEIRIDGMRERRSLVLTMKKSAATTPAAGGQKPGNQRIAVPSSRMKPIPSPGSAASVQPAKTPTKNNDLILDF